MRNLLAGVRLLGELDPALLDAAVKALGSVNREAQERGGPPSLWHSLRRLTGTGSQRTLATAAAFAESFGAARNGSGSADAGTHPRRPMASGAAIPVFAASIVVLGAFFWIGRRAASKEAIRPASFGLKSAAR